LDRCSEREAFLFLSLCTEYEFTSNILSTNSLTNEIVEEFKELFDELSISNSEIMQHIHDVFDLMNESELEEERRKFIIYVPIGQE
jgi:hypothetical protein